MGRFFQTAPTQFVDNYIYQPPWELMQQAASQKQKIYDAAIASTKLFDNIPIEHLQGEDDVYNVQEKQRYYAENAANIAKAIQNDPSKAQQYLNNIDSLQKELQKDFTTGDISKIQGSAQAYKKWQEDNKKLKEDDASRYTAAEKAYLGQYLNAGGNSISQAFKGEQVTKDVDWNKINEMAEKIKANSWSKESAGPNGGYIWKNKQSGETVTPDRINAVIMGQILQDPSNMAALRQSQQFGLAKYFGDDGNLDFNASGFLGNKMLASALAYSKQSQESDVQSDGTTMTYVREAGEDRRQMRGFAHAKDMKNLEFQLDQIKKARAAGDKTNDRIYKLQLDIAGETDPSIKKQKQDLLDSMTSAQFIIDLPKDVKYTDIKNLSKAAGKGDKDAYNVSWKSIDYARNNVKLSSLERELIERYDKALYKGDTKKVILDFMHEKGLDKAPPSKSGSLDLSGLNKRWNGTSWEKVNPNTTAQVNNFKQLKSKVDEYIEKRNEYLNEHSNTANSAYVGETLNPTGKTAATKLYQNYKDGFIAIDNKTKERFKVNPADVEIKGAISGSSYGSVALTGKYKYVTDKSSEERDITLVPSQNNPVLVSAARGIAISSTDPKGNIHNELSNWRINELKQTEANAKQAMKNTNEFVYRTYDSKGFLKSYNVNYSNGGYNIVNNQGAVIGTALGLDNLAEAINIDTNTK